MNNIKKRFLLFLFGCIPVRLLLVYLTTIIPLNYLPILGYIALIPAFAFAYIFINNSRQTGPETFGEKIWWNNIRPIHSALYLLFALYAINKSKNSWIFLLMDVIFGIISFLIFHYNNNDFKNLK